MQLTAIAQKKLAGICKKYFIESVYLFGSQTTGQTHKNSDTDMAVRFSTQLPLKKFLKLIHDLSPIFSTDIDIVDLDRAPLSIQYRIYKARNLLYAKNYKREYLKQAKSLTLYYDYQYYYDRFTRLETKKLAQYGLT